MATTIVLALVGLVLGAGIGDEGGMLFGLFIGLAFGMITNLKGRVFQLERDLTKLKASPAPAETREEAPSSARPKSYQAPEPSQTAVEEQTPAMPEPVAQVMQAVAQPTTEQVISQIKEETTPTATTTTAELAHTRVQPQWQDTSKSGEFARRADGFIDKVETTIREFFTTGNIVVKVGAIVLFFGIAFLLKYAAERVVFPIELRLMGVAAAGIAMIVVGWRMRGDKLEYGLILQGIGVGILYITVFAASKFYHLLPASMTFAILLLLVALSGLLAVKQNAKSLAIFGAIGGFLAPVLMSTGSGSHIMLFSYYAVLNLGIFGIAWFKSWRVLNFVGFVFTFIISAAWGYKSYQPEYFATTESFLLLFYFFYLTISVLFAYRQAPKLKGYVDGTLVFGLPLVAFALQSQIVDQYQYGEAITAAVMAVIYFVLAKLLWRPEKKGVRLLAESFLALGVTFGSLAIPLALDGRWTAAVWSLEGAALVWIGLRQSH